MEKTLIRNKLKKIRDTLPFKYQRTASEKIAKKLFALPALKQAQTLGLYMSKGSEVRTLPILKKLLQLKKIVAIPKVTPRSLNLHFHVIKNLQDCELGMFSILEPNSKCPRIHPKKIQVLIVPGIAFDKRGYRLGYGKGFYDRFIKKYKNDLTIGLTYHKTFVPKLPHQKTDMPVHLVITD